MLEVEKLPIETYCGGIWNFIIVDHVLFVHMFLNRKIYHSLRKLPITDEGTLGESIALGRVEELTKMKSKGAYSICLLISQDLNFTNL